MMSEQEETLEAAKLRLVTEALMLIENNQIIIAAQLLGAAPELQNDMAAMRLRYYLFRK